MREKHLNDYDVLLPITSSSYECFFSSFTVFPFDTEKNSSFIIYFPNISGVEREKKSIIVFICVSKGMKRKSQQHKIVYISPYFFPDLLKKTEKNEEKRRKKREEKNGK